MSEGSAVMKTVAGRKKDLSALREKVDRREDAELFLESLVRFVEKALSASETRPLVDLLLESVVRDLGFARASLYLAARDSMKLEPAGSLGLAGAAALPDLPLECGLARWLCEAGAAVHIDEYLTDAGETTRDEEESMRPLVDRGFSTAVALSPGGTLLGVLFCGGDGGLAPPDGTAGERLAKLARVAGVAIDAALRSESAVRWKAEIERFSGVKRAVLARASEDARMPLALLKSSLWSLEPEEIDEGLLVDMAKDAVTRLERKVSLLLSVSGIDLEGAGFRLERAEASSIVEDALRAMLPELEEKQVRVDVDDRAPLRRVLVDSPAIAVAVGGILDRAVASVARGGTIRVTLRVSDEPPGNGDGVEVWGRSFLAGRSREGSFLVVSVRDDGVGMPEDEVNALSQPLAPPPGAAQGKLAESSAGLLVSQRIVAGHGGRLLVKSELGAGSQFSIWLPLGA
jgi:signal transduction histidine kinase